MKRVTVATMLTLLSGYSASCSIAHDIAIRAHLLYLLKINILLMEEELIVSSLRHAGKERTLCQVITAILVDFCNDKRSLGRGKYFNYRQSGRVVLEKIMNVIHHVLTARSKLTVAGHSRTESSRSRLRPMNECVLVGLEMARCSQCRSSFLSDGMR